jgi:hypothetical protein
MHGGKNVGASNFQVLALGHKNIANNFSIYTQLPFFIGPETRLAEVTYGTVYLHLHDKHPS